MSELAILVPVLGRAHQIGPLLESIARATPDVPHRVVFICSPHDDEARERCQDSDGLTLVTSWNPGRADFARKINFAFLELHEPWLFQAATDLQFHPGWASRALHTAEAGGVGVIGTNDLGNPSVKRGTHATHILFSRSYIETYGGTFDQTGVVFSEVYDHQFVDTEFVQTAILRGQFKPCLRSVVEHLHPHWGKGEMDDTYRKSEREFHQDARLYNERMRKAKRILNRRPLSGGR